jgi:multidrug efflux pump subunit AcrA (membrane-fusion protein)
VARQKYVTLGQLDGGLRVVKDGLAAGDRVIINGLMRARPGMKVAAQDAGPQAAAPAAVPKPAGEAKAE